MRFNFSLPAAKRVDETVQVSRPVLKEPGTSEDVPHGSPIKKTYGQKNRSNGGIRLEKLGLLNPTAFFFAVKSDYIQSLGLSMSA